MVRGADYEFSVTIKNKGTGLPITDPELINGLEVVLRSSASRNAVKKYTVGSGIEAIEPGRYKITVPSAHTLLMPTTGRAFLEGFTLPVRRSIKIDLGNVTDNQINHPIPQQNG